MDSRKMMGIVIVVILVVAGVGAFAVLQGTSDDQGDDSGDGVVEGTNDMIEVLRIGTTNTVSVANIWDYAYGCFSRTLCHEGLIDFDEDANYVPELATDWTINENLTVWEFHLVDNATWHDGESFTSEDVKFSIEYDLDMSLSSRFSHVTSVETPDDYTVVINLDSTDYNFMINLVALQLIPEHVYSDIDDPEAYDGSDATLGTGPHEFVSFDKLSGTITFQYYEDYWGGTPAIETIKLIMFGNEDAMIMSLQTDGIDVTWKYAAGVQYYNVPSLMQNDDLGIMMVPDGGITKVLWFNTDRSPYDNVSFRQGVSYAIDYQEIINVFTAGYGDTPQAGWVKEAAQYYIETRDLEYDLEIANALLNESGCVDIDEDGWREMPDGSELTVELMIRSDLSEYVRESELIKSYLADVGINVEIEVEGYSNYISKLKTSHDYDMALARTTAWGMLVHEGYGTTYVDDDGGMGWSCVNDTEFLEIVEGLKTTQDAEGRQAWAEAIQEYYAEQMPQLTLYQMDIIQPYNLRYEGWVFCPMNGIMSYGTLFGLYEVE